MNFQFRRSFCGVAVLAAALVLGACSDKGKARVPAKLVDLPKSTIAVDKVWSDSVGNGSGELYTTLRVAVDDKFAPRPRVNGRGQTAGRHADPQNSKPLHPGCLRPARSA